MLQEDKIQQYQEGKYALWSKKSGSERKEELNVAKDMLDQVL